MGCENHGAARIIFLPWYTKTVCQELGKVLKMKIKTGILI